MPFPNTRQALEANGYSLTHLKVCPSCNVTIEMWNTPKSNIMPLDFKNDEHGCEVCVPHFATCKTPAMYSRRLQAKKEKDEAAAADAPMSPDAA
jgi:hypothetical protein